MLGAIHGLLEQRLPFAWVGFGADTAEMFALHSEFVEETGQARPIKNK